MPSPLPPGRPLAVVQPQEGAKVVADAETRYEFELFSGTVTSCSSEAQQPASNWLLTAARAVGLWKAPPVAAVHTWVVRAPDGASRTFRAATATADVPAQVGERVTVVSAPERGRSKQRRLLLSTAAPGMRPGEPMSVVNHRTGAALRLGRPPLAGQSAGLPGWVLPAAVLLAGSDAASALLDPALPALIAAGAAAAAGSAVAGNSLLLPRLKQLPSGAVKVEGMRQALLAQHAKLSKKLETTLQEASEDARALARLWQLQVKMESVGGGAGAGFGGSGSGGSASGSTDSMDGGGAATAAVGTASSSRALVGGGARGAALAPSSSGTYAARIGRVETARRGVEERLASRLELLDGYARVMNMIEIEVEMEIDVAAAELAGIGEQIERLTELEALQEEWRTQAEAQDEVRGWGGRAGVGRGMCLLLWWARAVLCCAMLCWGVCVSAACAGACCAVMGRGAGVGRGWPGCGAGACACAGACAWAGACTCAEPQDWVRWLAVWSGVCLCWMCVCLCWGCSFLCCLMLRAAVPAARCAEGFGEKGGAVPWWAACYCVMPCRAVLRDIVV